MTSLERVGAATDVGLVRQLNEDAYAVLTDLVVVADGMGGHAAGDVASRLTVEVLESWTTGERSVDSLRAAVQRANESVLGHVRDHPEAEGMGTTVAGLAVIDGPSPHWAAFNVGDSRVYRFDEVLDQLTVDHSEVEELVASGHLTRAEAAVHPSRHIITRAIGEPTCPEVDVVLFPVGTGRRFLLCSDGLTTMVDDDHIAAILAARRSPQESAELLVRRAVELGGYDNVTVIVVDEPHRGIAQGVDCATNPRNAHD